MPALKRRANFHNIHPNRSKPRQDWNKYNLYNIARLQTLKPTMYTYYQQKWKAKSATRGYHGAQIPEQRWELMFDRRAPAVVPMNAGYLANSDGSEHAAGRGSGLEKHPLDRQTSPPITPYMQMTYHPTERRLDTAIFRALFASSTLQARQFVTHGHVKVNGKEMRYPGYLLNPGDMFQVEPERVLFGTGAIKMKRTKYPNPESNTTRRRILVADGVLALPGAASVSDPKDDAPNRLTDYDDDEDIDEEDDDDDDDDEDEAGTEEAVEEVPEEEVAEDDPHKAIKNSLKALRNRIKDFLEAPPKGVRIPGKSKRSLRALYKTTRSTMSRAASTSPSTVDDLEIQFLTLSSRVTDRERKPKRPAAPPRETSTLEEQPSESATSQAASTYSGNPLPQDFRFPAEYNGLSGQDVAAKIKEAWSTGYHTPWSPKPFMSPFAFVPRYLEVNQSICSAVYLRHPVCKPGFAEVPTPFAPETSQLAFNWYLRRR